MTIWIVLALLIVLLGVVDDIRDSLAKMAARMDARRLRMENRDEAAGRDNPDTDPAP